MTFTGKSPGVGGAARGAQEISLGNRKNSTKGRLAKEALTARVLSGRVTAPTSPLWIVRGTHSEQLRVRLGLRDGHPIVQLDVLERFVSHCKAMTVVGRSVCVPPGEVPSLCDALMAAKAEAEKEAAS
jgi:hypothetical protein